MLFPATCTRKVSILNTVSASTGSCCFVVTERGNITKDGVSYRLRFLQKSHLAAKRCDDIPYGCVFCIHEGYTPHKDDATVFYTTKALFSHLRRHPRPLPEVFGVTAVEEAEVPEHLRNDYDVHLPEPPVAHLSDEKLDDVANRPTGMAKQNTRQFYNNTPRLYDQSPALELDVGAKVIGIKWPSKYKGEWIFAWHDGIFASVPADTISLNAPDPDEISRIGRTSRFCAKARWRFKHKNQKGEKAVPWLMFDKNDRITNICSTYGPPCASR